MQACEYEALDGGESILISAQSMINYLLEQYTKQDLAKLMSNDCIMIGRTLPGENVGIFNKKKPILSTLDNNNFQICYRLSDSYLKDVKEEIRNVCRDMNKFAENPDNRILYKLKRGEIIILDNTCNLHGRTPFYTEKRRLYRMNFFNDSYLSKFLSLGIRIL